jgi:hypothetical protein
MTEMKNKYHTHDAYGNWVPEKPEDGKKFELFAKAFQGWLAEHDKVMEKIELIGWNTVYDTNGFAKQDKKSDIAVKRYNGLIKSKLLTAEPVSEIWEIDTVDIHLMTQSRLSC